MDSFKETQNRRNTRSVKWDAMEQVYDLQDASDILPMWIADMDFPAPEPVLKAMKNRLEHPVFGYSFVCDDCKTAVRDWQLKRNNWNIEKQWLHFHQGIIPAIAAIIETFTEKHDKILVTPPVYPPFFLLSQNQGREVIYSELIERAGDYAMDFEDFEQKLQDASVFILCNPHNPGGRVWTESELKEIIRLCSKYDVLIISDEIHGDLIFEPNRHVPLAKIAGDEKDRIITCLAPTKTFNLAGIQIAMTVTSDYEKCVKLDQYALAHGTGALNSFASVALKAAYEECEPWLEQLLILLDNNMEFAIKELTSNVQGLRITKPQSTYLLWIDYRELGWSEHDVMEKLLVHGNVALEPGSKYGEAGIGFLRLNAACPQKTLEEGIKRIIQAFSLCVKEKESISL
ncbi:pyridoxal phosphate-dependent aminotransferase [Planococcus salinus]|uniref:cysteine-S-conjugate beta-lyase n=1 Tax=Planococcus salinus TaxID=1848460 RepID=A0A3M8PAW2_9BACL|nr:MalY/PatB family protein [Planococcus salinus]RNF40752.1 pyridoxal phosphate-dependent aminotransferase [Planococcus salinus]